MTAHELEILLHAKYKVLDFVDLSLISQQPSLGFKVFKNQFKPAFESRDRIVFFANGHVGARTLKYLQYAADVFDISRCFVLVCCSSHDTVSGSDDIEFFETKVDGNSFDDSSIISVDSFCVMPHMSVEFFNNGSIKTCCFIQDTLKESNDSRPVTELFYSDKMNQLRNSLLAGEKPASCQACWTNESKNLGSLRQWRNKSHRNEFLTDLIDHPKIRSCSLRVSTVCNFKCRICNYNSSSQWAEELLKYETDSYTLEKVKQSIKRNKWFDRDQTTVEEIKEICEDLDFIDIYGGEPLLIKQFKTVLEHCVKIGSAPRQRLHFNTNASVFPEETFRLMDHFKETHISLSIDDIGQRFELERGGCWSEVDHNVDRFLALDPDKYKISIQVTVSNLNLLYLDELLDWANTKQLTYTLQALDLPAVYQYTQVSQAVIDLAIKKYLNHENSFLRSLAESLQNTQAVDTSKWIETTQTLDHRREQCIKHSHPELAQAMGYV